MASLLDDFISKYEGRFDLDSISTEERCKVVEAVMKALDDRTQSLSNSQIMSALTTVRILSRGKAMVNVWMTETIFSLLMHYSSLSHYSDVGDAVLLPDNINTQVVTEATKCLCNLTFNSSKIQSWCESHKCVLSLIQRAKTFSDINLQHSVKYFDMRLMFIITALEKTTRTQASLDWGGIPVLSDIICDTLKQSDPADLKDEYCDLLSEVLKTLYNLVLVISPWKQEFSSLDNDIIVLIGRLQKLVCKDCQTKEKHLDIIKHVSNLFTALPTNSAQHLIPELSSPDEASTVHRTYEGHDVSAIAEILRYLEVVLEGTSLASQKEQLLPVVACLTILAKSHRAIRKYCRLRVLPHLRDEVKRLPEEGDSLRNRLCKLLTTPHTEVKRVVADLLYVLCKENVQRLIKYSGFGNAAGLLATYGLLGGQGSSTVIYSDDSDSETEEYKELEPNINPVTGRFESVHPDPMEGMTDEQKEYEAIQLLNAMDRLQRLGIVQPSRIGADGRPEPVEHVLQLAPDDSQTNQNEGESD